MLLFVNKGVVEMLDLLLDAIASLGIAGAQDVLTFGRGERIKKI